MKFNSNQAINSPLGTDGVLFTAQVKTEIRGILVSNTTDSNVSLNVKINDNDFGTQVYTPGPSENFNKLNNQILKPGDKLLFTGNGLNLLLSIIEIIE